MNPTNAHAAEIARLTRELAEAHETNAGLIADGVAAIRRGYEAQEALDEARRDVILAAGELMVPIPEPGTNEARLLLANVAMRRDRAIRCCSQYDRSRCT